jgi:hypothetical protein
MSYESEVNESCNVEVEEEPAISELHVASQTRPVTTRGHVTKP